MTALLGTALFLFFAFLQVEGLAIRNGANNASLLWERELLRFPPNKPVPVDLTRIEKKGAIAELLIPVTIEGVLYNLLLDTGSSALWVMSDGLKDPKYSQRQKYPLAMAGDCPPSSKINILYEDDSSVAGFWVSDAVDAIKVQGWSKEKYTFLAVTDIPYDHGDFFAKYNSEGMLGASLGPIDEGEPDPWLAGTRFTVDVNPSGTTSTLTFGDTDSKPAVTAKLAWDDPRWIVESLNLGWVHVDTGTEDLWLPADFLNSYFDGTGALPPYSDDNDSKNWVVDCDKPLPDMEFKFGENDELVKIQAKDIKVPHQSDDPDGKCQVRIVEETQDEELMVLGMPFFASNIVTYDGAARKVGVSPRD